MQERNENAGSVAGDGESGSGSDAQQHAGHGGGSQHQHHAMMVADFRRRFYVSLAFTIPILALSPTLREWLGLEGWRFPGDLWALLGLSTFVYVYGGRPFLTGLAEELSEKRPGMMTLVAVAISTAYIYSAAVVLGLEGMILFWETATLIDLMLLGHWIEMRSVMGASRALEELAKLMPAEAHRIRDDGSLEDVATSDLRPGDRIRVKSGEKVPADGKITEGRSSVDESMLTGESKPVKKEQGAEVVGGSINGTGSLTVEIRKTGAETYLSQVIALVREAENSKSRTQDLANRAALWLTVIALAGGAVTFIAWKLLLNADLTFSLERAVTVMVITCPHALGLAIPLVVAVSTGIAARRGLLIRNRAAFERAKDLDTVVFDKTGTLTEGRFGVTDIHTFGDAAEDEILRLAAAVEGHSEHPIAQGVLRTAEDRGISVPEAKGFEAITGQGVRAEVEDRSVRVLSPGAIRAEGLSEPDGEGERFAGQGKTLAYVVQDETPLGLIALADTIRPESKESVEILRSRGIRTLMLTGDNRQTAEWVAREIGLDDVIAEVLPDQKSAKIRELQAEGRIVAMTGDGVNDAPALATADLGIAVGAGTDVAVGTADVVLVRSDPRDAAQVVILSKATYRKMVQNLWYAGGYNIVAIPLAAGALAGIGFILSPAVGAVLMSLSTVVVAINARLLRA
jgi:P-type Cu2+ transporter